MIYLQAYSKFGKQQVKAGLIGTGQYSTAILGQVKYIPMLDIPVIAERSHEAAKKAFKHAGISEDDVVL